MAAAPAAFWVRWLLAGLVGVGAFGMALVLLPGPMQSLFNIVAFGAPDTPAAFGVEATAYLAFVYGVLGAVMAGWSIALLAIVHGPFRRGERWAWGAVTGSLGLWFVVDTTFSLVSGFPGNAVLNCVFALVLAVPLIATRALASSPWSKHS